MVNMNIQDFRNAVQAIPMLQNIRSRNGDVSHIDRRSAIHFLIYPFLNTLGYNIFNMEEFRLDYEKDGKVADLVIFENGATLVTFKILDIQLNRTLEGVKNLFKVGELNQYKLFGSLVVVLTNGLEYVIYPTSGTTDELVYVNLIDMENEEAVTFLYKSLVKSNLVTALTNNKFFVELVIESQLGHLSRTNYMEDLLRREIMNPSSRLIETLSELFYEEYCSSLDIDVIKASFREEFKTSGVLLEVLSNVIGVKEDKKENHNVESVEPVFIKEEKDTNVIVEDSSHDEWTKPYYEENDNQILLEDRKDDEDDSEGKDLSSLLGI